MSVLISSPVVEPPRGLVLYQRHDRSGPRQGQSGVDHIDDRVHRSPGIVSTAPVDVQAANDMLHANTIAWEPSGTFYPLHVVRARPGDSSVTSGQTRSRTSAATGGWHTAGRWPLATYRVACGHEQQPDSPAALLRGCELPAFPTACRHRNRRRSYVRRRVERCVRVHRVVPCRHTRSRTRGPLPMVLLYRVIGGARWW